MRSDASDKCLRRTGWTARPLNFRIICIDTITYAPEPPIALGARCTNLAAAGEALIAVCPLDDLVLRIDPRSGAITARADLPEPRGVFADAQGVWVLQERTVVRLDPVSLAAVAAFAHLPSVGL